MTWCSRGLRFAALALCGICEAFAQPAIDLIATPAWSGWSRPGAGTEIDVRLRAGVAGPAELTVAAGRQTVRTQVNLEPGRVVRLHIPVGSAESVVVTADSAGAARLKREVAIAQSESPLLAVAIASDDTVDLDGFHTIAVNPDGLPRDASAYSSIAALILDATAFAALDQRQLSALVAHAGACGRTVLVNAHPRPRQVLESAAGCSGRYVMSAGSFPEARAMLKASLASPVSEALSRAALGSIGGTDYSSWNRVLMLLAVYFGAAALVFTFSSSFAVVLIVPALSTAVVWAALAATQPTSQLFLWAEASSGARTARYTALQEFPAYARTAVRMPVMAQLGSVHPCDANARIRFDFDAARGVPTSARIDARLFQSVALCYSGNLPVDRAISVVPREGALDIRNTGVIAWPAGLLITRKLVQQLPALRPNEMARLSARSGTLPGDGPVRTALSRTPVDGQSALWNLQLAGIADQTIASQAWLFVSIPTP